MVGASPFTAVDRLSIIGAFRETGSHDPDVLRDRKRLLIRAARLPQRVGQALGLLGVVLAATRPGLLVGLPIVIIGAWLWHRGAHNVSQVERAYADYVKSPNP